VHSIKSRHVDICGDNIVRIKNIYTRPVDSCRPRTHLVQLQGSQNKSLPVSNATINDEAGVPTETLAKCKLKSKQIHYYYPQQECITKPSSNFTFILIFFKKNT
jgi:hypothetical protein